MVSGHYNRCVPRSKILEAGSFSSDLFELFNCIRYRPSAVIFCSTESYNLKNEESSMLFRLSGMQFFYEQIEEITAVFMLHLFRFHSIKNASREAINFQPFVSRGGRGDVSNKK